MLSERLFFGISVYFRVVRAVFFFRNIRHYRSAFRLFVGKLMDIRSGSAVCFEQNGPVFGKSDVPAYDRAFGHERMRFFDEFNGFFPERKTKSRNYPAGERMFDICSVQIVSADGRHDARFGIDRRAYAVRVQIIDESFSLAHFDRCGDQIDFAVIEQG